MSERLPAEPPMIALQQALTEIVEVQQAILTQQDQTKGYLQDSTTAVTDAAREMHTQYRDLLARIDTVQHHTVVVPPVQWPWWWWLAGGMLAASLAWGTVWWQWPVGKEVRLARALHSVLAQQWGQVPKGVQDPVLKAYHSLGYQGPGERK